ncbi:MAG: hypothetical protein JW939_06605 [Candidatus Thermoplasmatota archaeon]|nr:hypothetical protein [Candidatus Thermoplasmatota archaeon]
MIGRFRFAALLVSSLMIMISLTVLGPTENDPKGYADYNFYAPGSSTDFLTGYAELEYYYGSSSFYYFTINNPVGGGYYYNSNIYGYYRGWMPMSISDIDSDSLIDRLYFKFTPSYIGASQTLYFYLLRYDPRDLSLLNDGSKMYDYITSRSTFIGSTTVSSQTTYTISITAGEAVDYIRSKIASEDDYIFFGFRGSSSSAYIQLYADSRSYITITGDMEAPETPSPLSLPAYTTTQHVPLDWADVSDRPAAPNHGGVKYKVGAFSSTSMDSMIWSSDWVSLSSMNVYGLQEGTHYFRLKAKDAGDFETGWSGSYATTMIDRTPPTTAQIFDLPEYTNGTALTLGWVSSADQGSGVKHYMVGSATMSDFSDQENRIINHPTVTTSYPLTPGKTKHFVLLTYDKAGLMSEFSQPGHTTCDIDPPTVPIMMNEPPYTRGGSNSFSWYPSLDEGVGLHHYKIQVATTESFQQASIVFDRDTDRTTMEFDTLEDNVKYYARVQAVDAFHHESAWSGVEWSIQDHRGPGDLGIVPLMEYLAEGPVHLEWEGSEDAGSGVAWYEVIWSTDATFTTDVHSRDHVLGQSFQITDLDPGTTWYIKVVPYDSLGNPGPGEITFTTIDPQPPEQPVIGPLEEYTGGRACEVSWSPSTDTLSGLDHYILNVYTSPDRVGLAFSVHTTENSFVVPGLSDGTTYYYEVAAIDRAGNEIRSTLVHSTQDCSGPSVPGLVPVSEYQTSGLVMIEWSPSSDEGGASVGYQVQWATDIFFTNSVMESPWLTDTHYEIHDTTSITRAGTVKTPLPDGTYYIRSRSRDMFEQTSPWGNSVKIMIDTTPPDVPIVSPLPEYSGGSMMKISWEEVLDASGQNVEYQVRVSLNETGEPIMETPWTGSLNAYISDLEPYNTYYFRVVSRDRLGHVSGLSDVVNTTIDIDGPAITLQNMGLFGKADLSISGDVEDAGCGVELVELSYDGGQNWMECAYSGGKWSLMRSSLPPDTLEVLVRGQDKGGNVGSPVWAFIDEWAPIITLTHPPENARIGGPVQLTGGIADRHLGNYSISYQKVGTATWVEVVPSQSAGEFSGVLGTWDPSGLPGGAYRLRITAVDRLSQGSEMVLNVTLAGADLSIDPAQITFSDHHPLPGEKVTLLVTISNFGDSPAEDLTVAIYDNGELLHTQAGVTVKARSSMVITTEVKVSGTHRITARATSDLYDTGEMSAASVLKASEREMFLENMGGILGLIALILAIAAIVLILVLGGRKERKPEDEGEEKKEEPEENEEEEEQEKDDGEVISSPDITKNEPPEKQLPSAPTSQKPALPGIAIGTPLATYEAGAGQVPSLQPADLAAAPQLKPAPATMTPQEAPPKQDHVMDAPSSGPSGPSSAPSTQEKEKPEVELPDI